MESLDVVPTAYDFGPKSCTARVDSSGVDDSDKADANVSETSDVFAERSRARLLLNMRCPNLRNGVCHW